MKQRADKFMKYLRKKKHYADCDALGSGSSWKNAYAEAVDEVYGEAKRIFSGKGL
jgi:hypothetical protein